MQNIKAPYGVRTYWECPEINPETLQRCQWSFSWTYQGPSGKAPSGALEDADVGLVCAAHVQTAHPQMLTSGLIIAPNWKEVTVKALRL